MILDNLQSKERLVVAGVMSGTSLDGVDVAFAEIWSEGESIGYQLLGLHSRPYTDSLRQQLLGASAGELSSREVAHLDVTLGELYADIIASGLEENGIDPALLDAVGLHGQTIYHDPSNGVTQQIGSAAVIAERLATTIVNDFRTADVAAGGEGAGGDFHRHEDAPIRAVTGKEAFLGPDGSALGSEANAEVGVGDGAAGIEPQD